MKGASTSGWSARSRLKGTTAGGGTVAASIARPDDRSAACAAHHREALRQHHGLGIGTAMRARATYDPGRERQLQGRGRRRARLPDGTSTDCSTSGSPSTFSAISNRHLRPTT